MPRTEFSNVGDGPWACLPSALDAFARLLGDLAASDPCRAALLRAELSGVSAPRLSPRKPAQASAALAAVARASGATGYAVRNGAAVLPVRGIILRGRSAVLDVLGVQHTGMTDLRRDVAAAVADPAVKQIVLDVDSPGGQVAGITATGDAIFEARKSKPVVASGNGAAASAAYWLASAAARIVAEPDALIGSIGTFSVLSDTSEADARAGIRHYLVKFGEHKGDGVPGLPVTPEARDEAQRTVDGFGKLFVAAVARNRGMPESLALKLADGRAHLASKAIELALADEIGTLDGIIPPAEPAPSRGPLASLPAAKVKLKYASITQGPDEPDRWFARRKEWGIPDEYRSFEPSKVPWSVVDRVRAEQAEQAKQKERSKK